MNKNERRELALTVALEVARGERDREAAARVAAIAQAERLREQIVRLQARLEVLETAAAAQAPAPQAQLRGLASLITPPAAG